MYLRMLKIVFFSLLILSSMVYSEPLDTWYLRNQKLDLLNSITYDGKIFICAGENGKIVTSADGLEWTDKKSGTSYNLFGIIYSDSTFVAVGDYGIVLTSSNANDWIMNKSGTDLPLTSVVYGNNIFVAVGWNGTIITSADGLTWTVKTSGIPDSLYKVIYADNKFIAVGGKGTILTSADGNTWVKSYTGISEWLYGVVFNNKIFIAVGTNGTILTSINGNNWSNKTSKTAYSLYGICYGNSKFIAVGDYGTILSSTDGNIWTAEESNSIYNFVDIIYVNSSFLVIGNNKTEGNILISQDGISWIDLISKKYNTLRRIAYGSDKFVAVGYEGTIQTSQDGNTWTIGDSKTYYDFYDVIYCNNTFIAVGENGKLLASQDGITWTSKKTGIYDNLNGVVYANNIYVAIGGYGTILYSIDGNTWKSGNSKTTDYLYGIAYGNNTFIAVGEYGKILISSDGVEWTDRSSGINSSLYGIIYGKNIFVACGNSGIILISQDGDTWKRIDLDSYAYLYDIVYENDFFVCVGNSGAIFTSVDGSIWTERKSGTDNYLLGVIYGNNTFVAVGEKGTIIQSNSVLSPDLSVSPSMIDFGTIEPNSTSTAKTITCKNVGKTNIIIDTVVLQGSNKNEFILQEDSSSGKTLIPNETSTIKVIFSPVSSGKKSAEILISSNDPDKPNCIIDLDGYGKFVFPSISVFPENLYFESANVNYSSSAETVTVTNNGKADLIIDKIALSGRNENEYKIINDYCSKQAILPKDNKTFQVVLTPAAPGEKIADLLIYSNDPDIPICIISSKGNAFELRPEISVLPVAFDFSDVEIGGLVSVMTFTITNEGKLDLLINSITISGEDANEFGFQYDSCSGQTIAPQMKGSFQVGFLPISTGRKTASITIFSNDPENSNLLISLQGSGKTIITETNKSKKSKKSGCFISAAAICNLTEYRDKWFLSGCNNRVKYISQIINFSKKNIVNFYYKISPLITDFINP